MNKKRWAALLVFILAEALLLSQVFFFTLFPVFDRGHRVYGVTSRPAAQVVDRIFRELGGLRKDIAFRAGPTNQIMYYDGTVLNYLDFGPGMKSLPLDDDLVDDMPATGPSLVASDPQTAAETAVAWLKAAGFDAKIVPLKMNGLPEGSFAFVRAQVFDNDRWVLIFRWHSFRLGGRPKSTNFPNDPF